MLLTTATTNCTDFRGVRQAQSSVEGVSFFTALQEHAGLKLEAARETRMPIEDFSMRHAALIVLFASGVAVSSAQVPATSEAAPRFDVASIKPNTTSKIPLSPAHLAFLREALAGNAGNGRFSAQGDIAATPLIVLIQLAHNVKDVQIEGGPSWVRSDRYEVVARAEPPATFEQMRPMLQSLLAERFKLTLRRETRQLRVYDLLAAKDGPKIAAMKEGSCVTPEQAKLFGRGAYCRRGFVRAVVVCRPCKSNSGYGSSRHADPSKCWSSTPWSSRPPTDARRCR